MAKDTITVEMTNEQKNKVVDFLAKEQVLPTKSMFLNFQHNRNNKKYGPGTVDVPGELAGALEAADHQAMVYLLKQNQSSNTMIEILGRGVSRIRNS
jgi:hypothetical protein